MPSDDRPIIAVFGSSEPMPGDGLYREAYAMGRLLAHADYRVVTGGYGGVMEGASRGAAEGGGQAIGVTCEIFGERAPNPFLTETRPSGNLLDRTRDLIDLADGFVVLSGRAGTLAELAQLWALERARCLNGRPVVLLGFHWKPLLHLLGQTEMLEPRQLQITQVVATPDEAMALLRRQMP